LKLQTLKIENQYPFEFYGSLFLIYQTDQNKLVVPIQHMCEVLGMEFKIELRRIKSNEVFSNKLYMIRTQVIEDNGKAREKNLPCIAVQCLPYWVSWIDTKNVGKRKRAKIVRFQRSTLDYLWLTHCSDILPDTLITDPEPQSETKQE